jgi:hypothetical protein
MRSAGADERAVAFFPMAAWLEIESIMLSISSFHCLILSKTRQLFGIMLYRAIECSPPASSATPFYHADVERHVTAVARLWVSFAGESANSIGVSVVDRSR